MRYSWIAAVFLIAGCVTPPPPQPSAGWNPDGVDYADPNAVPPYGSYGPYTGYPYYGTYYGAYGAYPYAAYPCGSVLGCGALPIVTFAAARPVVVAPRAVVNAAPVVRPAHVHRVHSGSAVRFGGGRRRR